MMPTHNFDRPIYSIRWTLSDWFQILFENTVLSGRFTSVLINILFRISRLYQKSEENVDFNLNYDISCAHPMVSLLLLKEFKGELPDSSFKVLPPMKSL